MASPRFRLNSKKLVKPSVSTPPSLRDYKLSLNDQLVPDIYMPMAFFYPNQHHHTHRDDTSRISSLLQQSLRKILDSYYPFAGHITNNILVNCNGMGATLLEARIRCPMSEILKAPNINAQDIIFPSGLPWSNRHDQQSPVIAQLSHFDCGGKALSVCMSHKIGDGNTLCNFIKDWAAMTRQPSQKPTPRFIGASIFPPLDDPPIGVSAAVPEQRPHNLITRCFVFDSDKLNQLKAKATTESGVQKPTRVEVVNALLYQSAVAASMRCSSGSYKPSVFGLMVNLRPLVGLPASQNIVGNIAAPCFLSTTDERQMNFSRLVSEIRRIKVEKYEKYKRISRNKLFKATLDDVEQLMVFYANDDIEKYGCSSLCRFPTYDIDFGWGRRPIKVNLAAYNLGNTFFFLDNQMGGLEASITLEEQVMSLFQSDSELLTFASLNSGF